jgi:hypothetical protein
VAGVFDEDEQDAVALEDEISPSTIMTARPFGSSAAGANRMSAGTAA